MTVTIVTTKERPDLARITGMWRWEAFFKDQNLDDILKLDSECATSPDLLPTVLVLLNDQRPTGMVTLCLDDLDGRPELNPWLAGLYVNPADRSNGYGQRLVRELEAFASKAGIKRLSLYTLNAASFYAMAGWNTFEAFEHEGKVYSIMQKKIG